jgi:hypothetical protein
LKLAYSFTVALALAALPGCGSSLSSLCDDACDCTGDCSPDRRDNCVDDLEDAEQMALDAGCEDQFDEAIACIEDEFACRSGAVDIDGCSAPLQDLTTCANLAVTTRLLSLP